MLSEAQLDLIRDHAYIPEHLPDYFLPFSRTEPFLEEDIVYYRHSGQLKLIAYPLQCRDSGVQLQEQTRELVGAIKPEVLQVISPLPLEFPHYKLNAREGDYYSCLELAPLQKGAKLQNILRRAERECRVSLGKSFGRQEEELLLRFLDEHEFGENEEIFYRRLPDYLECSPGVFMVRATSSDGQRLLAYSVFEAGHGNYSYYLFNITDRSTKSIPGVNDLLLDTGLGEAQKRGSSYMNMGLGVNMGIERFKAKWGARRFLPYVFQQFKPRFSWKRLLGLDN